MADWFDRVEEVKCDIAHVKRSVENVGEHYAGVVALMPGMTVAELVDQGSDWVTIRTNEGLMKRTNIEKRLGAARLVLECDEEYQVGSKVSATSHFVDEFASSGASITHRLVISNVRSSGFLGFLYRTFGASNMGKAFLAAHKAFLEA